MAKIIPSIPPNFKLVRRAIVWTDKPTEPGQTTDTTHLEKGGASIVFEITNLIAGQPRLFVVDCAPPFEKFGVYIPSSQVALVRFDKLSTEQPQEWLCNVTTRRQLVKAGSLWGKPEEWESLHFNVSVYTTWVNGRTPAPVPQPSPPPMPAPLPQPSPPPTPSKLPTSYVVQPGDYLKQLAEKYYGDADQWQKIYQANLAVIGPNPDLIYPGQRLSIPR